MKQNQNPIHRKGDKNIICPHYRDCLGHAAKNHWKSWSCIDCHYKLASKSYTDMLVVGREATMSYNVPQKICKILKLY
jgi:hypothetical protein